MKPLSARRRRALIAATAGAILLIGAALVLSISRRIRAQQRVEHTQAVLRAADRAAATLVDAETGQRGYLLTGRDDYLESYRTGLSAHDRALRQLRTLTADNPAHQARLETLDRLAAQKRRELAGTIELARSRGLAAAAEVVRSDLGKQLMDSVRTVVGGIGRTEETLLAEQDAYESRLQRVVLLVAGLGTVLGVLLVIFQGGVLSRAVTAQVALSAELTERARQLEETGIELELSNEELHVINDELQQTVGELRTTTEELESANEELEATNEQLAAANDELHGSRADLEARQQELERAAAALRVSEERFRTLAEYLPVSLFVCQPAGATSYVNPAWTALTGLPAGQALERGWTATIHPEDLPRVLLEWSAALTGRPVDLHYRHVQPGGAVRHVRTTSAVVRTPAGEVSAVLGPTVDLTERFEVEEQLRHAQRMQAVGRLAGGIAHELNNMLTASIGFAVYALRSLTVGHPAVKDIAESLKAQERAARITSQVLSFSRRQMLAPTRFGLNDALGELAPLLRQSLEPGQALVLELAPDAGAVYADRTRLDQALLNIALNARDAMPEEGKLTLRTRRLVVHAGALAGPEGERLKPGEYAVISLEDSGAGMTAEIRRRAIEPFFTTKPQGEGTGLGLSMAYGFVRQSGGTLAIESEPERGTTVTLYLPVAVERAAAEVPAPSSRPESTSGEHVLVVDDEPSVRATMRRTLEEQGYEVIEAASGPEALTRLGDAPGGVHVVVCDLVMPGMSGDVLGAAIRERWPALPVLYVSGFPEADGEAGMMPPGAPFLRKPFSPDLLATRVRAVLDAR